MVKVHCIFSVFTLFLRRPGYELGPGTVTHLSSVLGGTPSELVLAGYQPFCAWPCPLLNSRPNLTVPLWDIMGMDIALCDITCITGVISTL